MQPTLKQVYELIDSMASFSFSAEFDNSGIQCGDDTQSISRILLCVDCTEAVADEACEKGCDLILSHHPLIFPTIHRLWEQDGVEKILRRLIRRNTALVASHTNTDYAKSGLCEVLSQRFGLQNAEPVEPMGNDGDGYGRVGNIQPVTVKELAKFAKKALSANLVRFTGNPDRIVKRIAVLSGSGTSVLDACLLKDAECVITGDVRYSQGLAYDRQNLSIIDAGHYDTEKVILGQWQSHLQNGLNALKYDVDVVLTSAEADIFTQV
jgi:dinuclear metal center YbgI/SA1388 family protein